MDVGQHVGRCMSRLSSHLFCSKKSKRCIVFILEVKLCSLSLSWDAKLCSLSLSWDFERTRPKQIEGKKRVETTPLNRSEINQVCSAVKKREQVPTYHEAVGEDLDAVVPERRGRELQVAEVPGEDPRRDGQDVVEHVHRHGRRRDRRQQPELYHGRPGGAAGPRRLAVGQDALQPAAQLMGPTSRHGRRRRHRPCIPLCWATGLELTRRRMKM
jgi:hypothetical protein